MATLVLSAVGSLIGGSIGALVGRQIDGAIFGGGTREGPRLKDLTLTTSSYGQPIARQFGRMRVGGTIVWATDLVERREKSGGGKGKPSVTSYSYSTSFAVALSSRPIAGVGRIWADGNLLRGAAGDLKVGGTLRIHSGYGDQPPDPLMAAALGSDCPAHRGTAYAVFEDLELADFGNRIPALTFEVVADPGGVALADLAAPLPGVTADGLLPGLAGFEHAGGATGDALATIAQLYPLTCHARADRVLLDPEPAYGGTLPVLPGPVAIGDGDEADAHGWEARRAATGGEGPAAVRYYDVARDYQPGVQRAEVRRAAGPERTVEFPGALAAETARALVQAAARRAGSRRETMRWRIAAIDPALGPGAVVALPSRPGRWEITAWEWREHGIDLELERRAPPGLPAVPADPGTPVPPADLPREPTWLRAFEIPWDGLGSPSERRVFVAASAASAGWTGAALYAENGTALEPIGTSGRLRSSNGTTAAPLAPSAALRFEPQASLIVALVASDMEPAPASSEQLAQGANRLLVGQEIVQFAGVEPLGDGQWRLEGLLRGRGATEAAAHAGHAAGVPVVQLDDRILALAEADLPPDGEGRIGAIGLGDAEPVLAAIAGAGSSRLPLPPVHPRAIPDGAGGLRLHWTRRARGNWAWREGLPDPLVEDSERYRIGAGPVEQPLAQWETVVPRLDLAAGQLSMLPSGAALWVRQIGSHGLSAAVLLHTT